MTKTIYIKDIINDTARNDEGKKLFGIINDNLKENHRVCLSLKDLRPMSSSFLNASFGAIIDNYGVDFFKKKITLTDYTKFQANYIKEYISRYSKIFS
jgi:hypothetical protein